MLPAGVKAPLEHARGEQLRPPGLLLSGGRSAALLSLFDPRSGGGAPNNKPWKMAVLLVVGTLFCSLPISWAGYLALSAAPGE